MTTRKCLVLLVLMVVLVHEGCHGFEKTDEMESQTSTAKSTSLAAETAVSHEQNLALEQSGVAMMAGATMKVTMTEKDIILESPQYVPSVMGNPDQSFPMKLGHLSVGVGSKLRDDGSAGQPQIIFNQPAYPASYEAQTYTNGQGQGIFYNPSLRGAISQADMNPYAGQYAVPSVQPQAQPVSIVPGEVVAVPKKEHHSCPHWKADTPQRTIDVTPNFPSNTDVQNNKLASHVRGNAVHWDKPVHTVEQEFKQISGNKQADGGEPKVEDAPAVTKEAENEKL
eukprot:GILJ01011088.1.p1 GENE.GILJ01011088.1~~GILJ01011088.1.p1  ORF type:complete len:282 (-),score=43.28 GILJ01011088.1:95-940(-)